MKPHFALLDEPLIERILAEAFDLLQDPGIEVHNTEALHLLGDAGAQVDATANTARLPEDLVRTALRTVPSSFALHNADGEAAVRYEDDQVQFDPGSAAVYVLDSDTKEHRVPTTRDVVRYAKLTEGLPQIDAISTALVTSDVPEEMADLYRLYLVLLYSTKPIVTGAFRIDTLAVMRELLLAEAGTEEALAAKPRAVFDVCPSPPLLWSDITCQNMIDCARYGIPAELVSMPLAGGTGPATLVGSVVQHAAETLSGIAIHQLAKPGSPIVWGGSPAIFDMRHGTPPMGAIETAMIDCAYAEVGKYLGLPTHAYLGMSDAKIVDAQAGLESGIGAILAALTGVNMVSGPGMLNFESTFSLEKLVVDAEIAGMAKRLARGIEAQEESLATALIRQVGHHGSFLETRHTLKWFAREQYIPSPVIDRGSLRAWHEKGSPDTFERAKARAEESIGGYKPKALAPEVQRELQAIVRTAARRWGMDALPALE